MYLVVKNLVIDNFEILNFLNVNEDRKKAWNQAFKDHTHLHVNLPEKGDSRPTFSKFSAALACVCRRRTSKTLGCTTLSLLLFRICA